MRALLLQLFTAGILGSLARSVRFSIATAALQAIAAVFALISAGFFTAAAFLALSHSYSPVTAALVIGGFYLAICLIIIIIMLIRASIHRARSGFGAPVAARAAAAVEGAEESMTGGKGLFDLKPIHIVGLALLAGIIAGRKL